MWPNKSFNPRMVCSGQYLVRRDLKDTIDGRYDVHRYRSYLKLNVHFVSYKDGHRREAVAWTLPRLDKKIKATGLG